MKKYPPHSTTPEVLRETPGILELPTAPDFDPHPPQIDPQVMLQRIAQNMRWRNSRSGEAERRLAEKIPVEFVL